MKLFYGSSIKIYRRKNRIKQEELAGQLHISKAMLGMLENNNRNASEEVENRIKHLIGISLDKKLQEMLIDEFKVYLTKSFDFYKKKLTKPDFNRSLKNLPQLSKMYFSQLGEQDFVEIYNLIDIPVYLPYIHNFSRDFYEGNLSKLKKFYNTYTAFLLDNTDNILEVINSYLSKDSKITPITVFKDKLPLNIKTDFEKITKNINSTTYADYNVFQINTYPFEKQLGFIVKDDSMNPKYEIGNIIIVSIKNKVEESIENNKDYLIRIGKEFIIRRIQIENEQILLKPLNYNYDIKNFTKDNMNKLDIEIIGKITDIKIN